MPITIKQVAERAGVSTATVSYVLNGTGTVSDATRQRVLIAMAELDYQPSHAARSMRGRSHTLGIALPALATRLADPAQAEVLAGLVGAGAMRGYSVLLAPQDSAEGEAEHCVGLLRSGRVDGIVLFDIQTDDERASALSDAGLPHVCAGLPPARTPSPFVAVDGQAAANAATRHLISLGHRRVGLIQLPSELTESEPQYQGYAEVLSSAELPLDPTLVIEAGRREEDGFQAMHELLAAPDPPTAVLACNDELAFGAMHAIYDVGLEVGRDVSLIGFDDVPLAAHTYPPLTTLRQPRRLLGEHIANLLIDLIEHRLRSSPGTRLSARLVIRRSTGPPVVR